MSTHTHMQASAAAEQRAHPRPSLCTASGLEFFPFDPRPENVRLDDIAHALARICRFAGHTRDFYSVAQHSVHVVEVLRDSGATDELLRLGLLHDAAEAYLGDVPGPLKRLPAFAGYVEAENHCTDVILEAFDVAQSPDAWHAVKHADLELRIAEQAALMPECDWWTKPDGVIVDIVAWPSETAAARFMAAAATLGLW